jgi:ubiquitin carboxyl-terminal hydrolase 7
VLLYYERLDIPIEELEQLCALSVEFLRVDPKMKVSEHTVHAAMGDSVESLIVSTLKAAESDANPAECRLVKTYLNRIKDFEIDRSCKWDSVWSKFDDYRVEVVPEAEKAAAADSGGGTRVVECFHYFKVPTRAHGIPFMFTVVNGETVGDLRERLRAHLKVPKAQFCKWKFGIEFEKVSDLGTMEDVVKELTEDETVIEFEKVPATFALALDHVDRTFNTFSHNPGAIKIHN